MLWHRMRGIWRHLSGIWHRLPDYTLHSYFLVIMCFLSSFNCNVIFTADWKLQIKKLCICWKLVYKILYIFGMKIILQSAEQWRNNFVNFFIHVHLCFVHNLPKIKYFFQCFRFRSTDPVQKERKGMNKS